MFFSNAKPCTSFESVITKQGFAWWVRERDFINNPSRITPKYIPKSMNEVCKIHARRSYQKTFKRHRKFSPNGIHNPVNKYKKYISKNQCEKEAFQIGAKFNQSKGPPPPVIEITRDNTMAASYMSAPFYHEKGKQKQGLTSGSILILGGNLVEASAF